MTDFSAPYPMVPFGQLIEFVFRGISYSKQVLTDDVTATPMVNLANIGKGGGFRPDGFKYYSGPAKNGVSLKPGDLVIANTDLSSAKDVLGSPVIIPESVGGRDVVFTHHITKLIPDESKLELQYLRYFLESPVARQFMKAHGSGTTVMNLQTRALPKLEIPLPPIAVQQRLVATLEDHLSRLDKVLAEIDSNASKLPNLRRALLDELYRKNSESTKELGRLTKLINGDRGKNYPSKSKRVSSGIPFINAGHLDDGFINMDQMDFISDGTFESLGSGKVQPGDVLFCLRGSLGKVGIVRDMTQGAIASSLAILRPNPEVLPEYLLGYFQTSGAHTQIKKFDNGTAQPNLSSASLSKFEVPFMNLASQTKVVEEAERLKVQLLATHNSLKSTQLQLTVLRRSLLNKAFNGGI